MGGGGGGGAGVTSNSPTIDPYISHFDICNNAFPFLAYSSQSIVGQPIRRKCPNYRIYP